MRHLTKLVAVLGGMALPVVLLAAVPIPAQDAAAAWVAQMEDEEGGPAMVASSPAEDSAFPALRLMCADMVSIRYDAGEQALGLEPGSTVRLEFSTSEQSLVADFQYEEMDGALALYVEQDDPWIDMLKHGSALTVVAPDDDMVPRGVSLAGSGAAIDKLLATCG